MRKIPNTGNPLVIRTFFDNDTEWEIICKKIIAPDPILDFKAYVDFLSSTEFENCTPEDFISIDEYKSYEHYFIFIVDEQTITNPEYPILCIGLKSDKGKAFRIIPSKMWSVENNLSIANMDFEDFQDTTDEDGVYRGVGE
ncbi:MAG: hypothetical protein MUE81_00840 [Thermoflexibacter sp.]|jgi:hypothetical protein|nr:hypothetical protein [Thermoflexibacter sp.]